MGSIQKLKLRLPNMIKLIICWRQKQTKKCNHWKKEKDKRVSTSSRLCVFMGAILGLFMSRECEEDR